MEPKNQERNNFPSSEEGLKPKRQTPAGSSTKERHHLYDLFMQAPAMIAIVKGPDHIFEFANPLYMQLVGQNRDIIGKPVRDALVEIEEQGFIRLLDEVYRTGKPYSGYEELVKLNRNQNGEIDEAFLNFIYQPTLDESGKVDGIFVHIVDVTEQVNIRQRNEESEHKYRSLFNSVDQGFCILEIIFNEQNKPEDYRFLETNPVFEKQTGLKNPVGKTARELVPDLEDHWPQIYGKVAMTGRPEKFVEGSDAMGRWFEVYAFPISKNSPRVALLFTDITERKKEESVRQKLMSQLEQRVQERTKALNNVNLALQKSNEDLLQFAHVASHDLKEPIRKIQTFADLLGSDEESRLSQRAKLYLGKINNASQRMVSMIEGVLRYSAMDSYGQITEVINLDNLLDTITSDLEVLIREKDAQLKYRDLPEFEGAPILVFQLFYNLLNNSLKFTQPGIQPVITLTGEKITRNNRDFARIKLKDNGIGFEQAYAERIFNTFTRLHSKDQFEGTGLGLSLCRKIMHRHNGKIWAKGELHQGAEFHIEFPVKQLTKLV